MVFINCKITNTFIAKPLESPNYFMKITKQDILKSTFLKSIPNT